jgi:hypothetical protein
MKTKALLKRYLRKLLFIKDLGDRISRSSLRCKSMKTGGELEIPSKISLLKDLAKAFWRVEGLIREVCDAGLRGNARVKGKMVSLECNQKGSGVQPRGNTPPKRSLDGPPSGVK